MTEEQKLLNKKEKAQNLLKEKLEDRKWFADRVGKELIAGFDGYKANLEDIELEIEILQEYIDNIDKYLRDKNINGDAE